MTGAAPAPWLLDTEALDRRLASGEAPLPLLREALSAADEALATAFEAGQPVAELVAGRADVVDALLQRLWDRHLPAGPTLVAVGGYGRGELHPGSDIDILILLPEGEEPPREALETFLTLLWDVGLEVGQSVRTVAECEQEARADITVATNLMEARPLAGDPVLFRAMREATGAKRLWGGRAFFEAKWDEQIARHRKYFDAAYNLEPNIKEGPGGLRDIQMVGWVAKRHFGADSLADLVDHGFLTAEEHAELVTGQHFLWRVRFGLHLLAGRREDRLLFEHQRTLAERFGYRDDDRRLAVEHFMKAYYRTITGLSRLNEMLLQLFQEEILLADDPAEPFALNEHFQARRGFLEVRDPTLFERHPCALLELFLVMARNPQLQGVRAHTIRLVRRHRHLIGAEFRTDPEARRLFLEFLRQPRGVTHELRRMHRYGILGAYLPAFGAIVGQMQHDLYHVYTVDEHTLFVVRNLRRLTVPEFAHEHPLASALMGEVERPELLYIAALFHDIAKGRGGDHSRLGAADAATFCRDHGLSEADTDLVVWLVENHLLFSTTAQRQDISDPEVIHTFTARTGDRRHLDYLYLLTVADIRATSPTVWNSWKDALLAELYHATRDALARGPGHRLAAGEIAAAHQAEARRLLRDHAIDPEALEALWNGLDADYFRRHSPDELVWHAHAILTAAPDEVPLLRFRQQTQRGGTELFIHAPAEAAIFVRTASVLEQLGLDVADARIFTTAEGRALNSFTVLEESGEPIRSGERMREIGAALEATLSDSEPPPVDGRRPSRRQRHFPVATRVEFRDDPAHRRTVLHVETADRPGLLARVGGELLAAGVRIASAKIATFGERAEDVFFVTDPDGRPLRDPTRRQALAEAIRQALDRETESAPTQPPTP
ncbi:MAG: [protein-PII] uridylyltransferase [Pseudomonadota bacterium]